jgi:predicted RNase H-like HicB family nuclease
MLSKEVYVEDTGDGEWDLYWDAPSGYYVQTYKDYEVARSEAKEVWDWIICSRVEDCDYGKYEEGQRVHLLIPSHGDFECVDKFGEVYPEFKP